MDIEPLRLPKEEPTKTLLMILDFFFFSKNSRFKNVLPFQQNIDCTVKDCCRFYSNLQEALIYSKDL